jgi:excisionase family DNA binding protein
MSATPNGHRIPTEPSGVEPGGPPRLDDPLLRPDQAAQLLNVKTSWIYEAVRTGSLPCLRVGRHIRFTRMMLEDWLSTRR